MLEFFDQNPQSRVFHLDDECYVVYLGSHWEDYHPFLRIGTSSDLPSDLPPIISTIVVPDTLTGNPLDEASCLVGDASTETHYVGDVKTVEIYKEFVGKEGMPVEAIEETDHEEEDGKRVLVYYYKDGNLKIKFRKNEILDLRRREKVDSHFVGRAQEAKNDYGKSPFKMPGGAYQGTGFLVADGTPYLAAKGELAALSLQTDYFFSLSAAGIDADRVRTVHIEKPTEALIRLFKRSRGRGAVRVSTTHPKDVQRVASLFAENTLPALDAKVLEGSGGSFTFHGYSVSLAPNRFEAQLEGAEGPVVFGAHGKKSPGSLVVDPKAHSISYAGSSFSAPLLDGVLYHLVTTLPTRTSVEADYLPEKNYPYRDLVSEGENTLLGQLQYYFNEVFAGRDPGKVLRSIKGLEPVKALGRSGGGVHPVIQVLLHNYAEFARLVKTHEPQTAKAVDPIISVLEKSRIDPSTVPSYLPLVGDLVSAEGEHYLFYSLSARITSDRYAHAPVIAERILAQPVMDFEAERSRLAELIAGLATPEQMDEARMRRIAESRKKQPPKKSEPVSDQKETPASGQASGKASGETAAGSTGTGGRGRSPRRRGGGWVVPAGIAALLLVALFLLLLTNVIPNPWFADDPAAVAGVEDGGSSREDEDGIESAGGSETGDTGTDSQSAAEPGTAEPGDDPIASEADGTDGASERSDPTVPEGWPQESLPALRALDQMPDVVISDDGVTGPGGIEITIMDIIRLVNRIAGDNGFDPMGEAEVRERDPDWIFPGSVFELPNRTRYTVVRGDTLWGITVRFMIARLREDFSSYQELTEEYERESTADERREQIASQLRRIASESHTENFVALVNEKLSEWEF